MCQKRFALAVRSLIGSSWQTILPIIKRRQSQTLRRLSTEKVIRVSEVLQIGKLANRLWDDAGKHVVG